MRERTVPRLLQLTQYKTEAPGRAHERVLSQKLTVWAKLEEGVVRAQTENCRTPASVERLGWLRDAMSASTFDLRAPM